MSKVLLISVKPEFAEKIFAGVKRIELRKSRPSVTAGDIVIVYSTLPEKAVLGSCTVKEVVTDTPVALWNTYHNELGIDKKRYFEYYKDMGIAVGIVLTSVQKFPEKIPLETIRKDFPQFTPPQTFKYFQRNELIKAYKAYAGVLRA